MAVSEDDSVPNAAASGRRRSPKSRRPASVQCLWCGTEIDVFRVGRVPSWCSNSCRHRAWEQRRAAASGLAARELVERYVEVEVHVPVTRDIEVEVLPKGAAWAAALHQLADQIDRGLVYDRDLTALAGALEGALAALNRRPARRLSRRAW